MSSILLRTAAALSLAIGVGTIPANAQLISAAKPEAIKQIVESRGWPAKVVTEKDKDPYIESSYNGMKFIILFMNCESNQNCKTLQYYAGFTDAKGMNLERYNQWNKEKRFGRAYRDDEGDPVIEMDIDLDFKGLPRQNVGESLSTWSSLMSSYYEFVYKDDKDDGDSESTS